MNSIQRRFSKTIDSSKQTITYVCSYAFKDLKAIESYISEVEKDIAAINRLSLGLRDELKCAKSYKDLYIKRHELKEEAK